MVISTEVPRASLSCFIVPIMCPKKKERRVSTENRDVRIMLESSLIVHYRRDSNIFQDSFATSSFKAFQRQNRLIKWIHAKQENVGMSLIFGKLMFRKRLAVAGR